MNMTKKIQRKKSGKCRIYSQEEIIAINEVLKQYPELSTGAAIVIAEGRKS